MRLTQSETGGAHFAFLCRGRDALRRVRSHAARGDTRPPARQPTADSRQAPSGRDGTRPSRSFLCVRSFSRRVRNVKTPTRDNTQLYDSRCFRQSLTLYAEGNCGTVCVLCFPCCVVVNVKGEDMKTQLLLVVIGLVLLVCAGCVSNPEVGQVLSGVFTGIGAGLSGL